MTWEPMESARREARRQADVAYLRLLNEALTIGRRKRDLAAMPLPTPPQESDNE